MKKKQKINKAVNSGEWLLLGLTALFLLFLFLIRERPAPARGISVRTSAARAPVLPDAAATPDAVPASDSPDSGPISGDGDASDSVPASAPADDSASRDDGRVNINTADLSELCALPGVGEALAGRIIDYREQYGPFARPEDIMRVSGIGQGKFSAMEALITV